MQSFYTLYELIPFSKLNCIGFKLFEILFLSIIAVAGKAPNWKEIEFFGKANLKLLRQYYPFKNGAPSDDTIRRTSEVLDPEGLNKLLREYFTVALENEHIAIDGKSLRGSGWSQVRFLDARIKATACAVALSSSISEIFILLLIKLKLKLKCLST